MTFLLYMFLFITNHKRVGGGGEKLDSMLFYVPRNHKKNTYIKKTDLKPTTNISSSYWKLNITVKKFFFSKSLLSLQLTYIYFDINIWIISELKALIIFLSSAHAFTFVIIVSSLSFIKIPLLNFHPCHYAIL